MVLAVLVLLAALLYIMVGVKVIYITVIRAD
jgi:hypothetical protein